MNTRNMCMWIVVLFVSFVPFANSFWGDNLIRDLINCFSGIAEEDEECAEQTDMCDEMQIMLHLACLRVTSPERILHLLSWDSTINTCNSTYKVLGHINDTLQDCMPLPPQNLYMRLYHALEFFYEQQCGKAETKSKHLEQYRDCIRELRDDLIDCEGPADWFERRSKTYVCSFFAALTGVNWKYQWNSNRFTPGASNVVAVSLFLCGIHGWRLAKF
ncbi:uncharacterized protein [Eurosta solidaginis]|uniref:uncharacterized protein isoform X1 n=1 Tax=Eurosta solidaginis TaxID=178769 RepID=UPI00353108FE